MENCAYKLSRWNKTKHLLWWNTELPYYNYYKLQKEREKYTQLINKPWHVCLYKQLIFFLRPLSMTWKKVKHQNGCARVRMIVQRRRTTNKTRSLRVWSLTCTSHSIQGSTCKKRGNTHSLVYKDICVTMRNCHYFNY